jgi:preprotein translocase subunit SecF
MFNIIENRRWYLIVAGILVALSIVSLVVSTIVSGLPLALDIDTTNPQTIQAAGISALVMAITVPALIWWLFRGTPNVLRWSASAVVVMACNLLVPFGFYALMGMLVGWQADTLFFVAILVVTGLSIQDVMPLLSRIHENAATHRGESHRTAANRSILERFNPTLATRLCAVFILVALLFVGGSVILPLAATLLVGVIFETYSSIFVTALLLTL